jgi:hypothetical protein
MLKTIVHASWICGCSFRGEAFLCDSEQRIFSLCRGTAEMLLIVARGVDLVRGHCRGSTDSQIMSDEMRSSPHAAERQG